MPASDFQQNQSLLSAARRRPLILLVDEGTSDLDRYRQLLHDNGFQVWSCANFDEGTRCLDRKPFDGIVLDQGGPTFEARVVLERSVAKDRRRPVIIITRHHSMDVYLEAMQLGAVDYLEKPLTGQEILRVLQTHLPSEDRAA